MVGCWARELQFSGRPSIGVLQAQSHLCRLEAFYHEDAKYESPRKFSVFRAVGLFSKARAELRAQSSMEFPRAFTGNRTPAYRTRPCPDQAFR